MIKASNADKSKEYFNLQKDILSTLYIWNNFMVSASLPLRQFQCEHYQVMQVVSPFYTEVK